MRWTVAKPTPVPGEFGHRVKPLKGGLGVGLIETGAIVTDEIGRNPIKMHLTEFDTSGRSLRGKFPSVANTSRNE
jgi:hypothetical protein